MCGVISSSSLCYRIILRPYQAFVSLIDLDPAAVFVLVAYFFDAFKTCLSDAVMWSDQAADWFNMSINSEHTFTGYIHQQINGQKKYTIDLYADGQDGFRTGNIELPSIESNIGYMMLLVNMASPFALYNSHLDDHLLGIEQVCCESFDGTFKFLSILFIYSCRSDKCYIYTNKVHGPTYLPTYLCTYLCMYLCPL